MDYSFVVSAAALLAEHDAAYVKRTLTSLIEKLSETVRTTGKGYSALASAMKALAMVDRDGAIDRLMALATNDDVPGIDRADTVYELTQIGAPEDKVRAAYQSIVDSESPKVTQHNRESAQYRLKKLDEN